MKTNLIQRPVPRLLFTLQIGVVEADRRQIGVAEADRRKTLGCKISFRSLRLDYAYWGISYE